MYVYFRMWCIPENNNFGSEINCFRNIAFGEKVVLWHNLALVRGKLCLWGEYVGVNCASDFCSKTEHFNVMNFNAI